LKVLGEVKQEAGLDVKSLKYCGVVHWIYRKNEMIVFYEN